MTPTSLPEARQTERDAAFARWVQPHLPLAHTVARRSAPDAADDVVQDALLRAYRSLHRFDGRYPKAWLARIVQNAAYDHHRRRQRHACTSIDDVAHPAESGTDDLFDARTLSPAVEVAFRNLSQAHRDIVVLVDVDGHSYREAAAHLGVAVGTVMSRLARARAALRAGHDKEKSSDEVE
ncbi:MAG: RNA polymerase sigma factor [Acidimicrobiales bacterium]